MKLTDSAVLQKKIADLETPRSPVVDRKLFKQKTFKIADDESQKAVSDAGVKAEPKS